MWTGGKEKEKKNYSICLKCSCGTLNKKEFYLQIRWWRWCWCMEHFLWHLSEICGSMCVRQNYMCFRVFEKCCMKKEHCEIPISFNMYGDLPYHWNIFIDSFSAGAGRVSLHLLTVKCSCRQVVMQILSQKWTTFKIDTWSLTVTKNFSFQIFNKMDDEYGYHL